MLPLMDKLRLELHMIEQTVMTTLRNTLLAVSRQPMKTLMAGCNGTRFLLEENIKNSCILLSKFALFSLFVLHDISSIITINTLQRYLEH